MPKKPLHKTLLSPSAPLLQGHGTRGGIRATYIKDSPTHTFFLCPSPNAFNLVPYYDTYPLRMIYLRKCKEDLEADGYEFI